MFRQTRVGKDGRLYSLLKFRSMYQEAEKILQEYIQTDSSIKRNGTIFEKIKNDHRVTRMGKFVRKYILMSVPQLWNVLVGEIGSSVVGPRPFLPQQRELYGDRYSYYIRIRPGITGYWQVSGRNTLGFAARAYWDEYYVEIGGNLVDVYIMIRTFFVVFQRSEACKGLNEDEGAFFMNNKD